MKARVGRRLAVLAVFMVLLGTTVSAAPQPGRVHFTAAGDFAQGTNAGFVLDAIKNSGSDFTMTLGDMSYGTTGTEQDWCDFVKGHVGESYPFEMIAGNHESNGLNGNINDFSACLPNQLPGAVGTYGRQYYVDVPAEDPIVRYVMISPGLTYPDGPWSYADGTAHYNWTAQAIDGARAASIPWVVVGMHKPCITVGLYSCESGVDLFNLLLEKKVDLVLSGHEHNYQRSHQLGLRAGCASFAPEPTAFKSSCVVDSDSAFAAGAGTVSAVVGSGGQAARDVDDSDVEAPYFAATSGLNKNSTYGALDVTATDTTLSASFLRGSGGTQNDSFTITRGPSPPNTSPVAAFTAGCTDLTCSFNATGSNDPDGTIASYAWNFGDGTFGSGPTPTHTYAVGRSYTVGLTVTDNGGATGSATNNVAPAPPATTTYASDQFTRTVATGWGSAPTGGTWAHTGAANLFSVGAGVGTIRTNTGSGPTAQLTGVSTSAVDLQASFSLDKPPTGSGIYVSAWPRRTPTQGSYFTKARVLSNGTVSLELLRMTPTGTEASVQAAALVPGLTYAVGDALNLRVQATGTAPTTLRAKVWKVGTVEPSGWQRSATDSTSGLQVAGYIGVGSYLSGSATNGPITTKFDTVVATAP